MATALDVGDRARCLGVLLPNQFAGGGHRQVHVGAVVGQALEPVLRVESSQLLVLRINLDRGRRDRLRELPSDPASRRGRLVYRQLVFAGCGGLARKPAASGRFVGCRAWPTALSVRDRFRANRSGLRGSRHGCVDILSNSRSLGLTGGGVNRGVRSGGRGGGLQRDEGPCECVTTPVVRWPAALMDGAFPGGVRCLPPVVLNGILGLTLKASKCGFPR